MDAFEDIFALQGDLKSIRHTRHVVAPTGPPDDVEDAYRSEVSDQCIEVVV
jgi:hypothetical protein